MPIEINQKIGSDGKIVQTYKNSNGVLYRFTPETGDLEVSMHSSDLEILLAQIGEIPEEGKDIKLQIPTGFLTFENVKKIESIPGLEKGYLIEIKYQSKGN